MAADDEGRAPVEGQVTEAVKALTDVFVAAMQEQLAVNRQLQEELMAAQQEIKRILTQGRPRQGRGRKAGQSFPQEKKLVQSRVKGTVLWFSVRKGYGFIGQETGRDLFVHWRGIESRNPDHRLASLAKGEEVEMDIVEGRVGLEAVRVTAPARGCVEGNEFAPVSRRKHSQEKEQKERVGTGKAGECPRVTLGKAGERLMEVGQGQKLCSLPEAHVSEVKVLTTEPQLPTLEAVSSPPPLTYAQPQAPTPEVKASPPPLPLPQPPVSASDALPSATPPAHCFGTGVGTFEEWEGDVFSCDPDDSMAHCVSENLAMNTGIAAKFRRMFGQRPYLLAQGKGV